MASDQAAVLEKVNAVVMAAADLVLDAISKSAGSLPTGQAMVVQLFESFARGVAALTGIEVVTNAGPQDAS